MRRRRAPHAASVLPSLAGGAVHPVGLGVETVDERHPHLGWQSELARHHPLTIDPVAQRTAPRPAGGAIRRDRSTPSTHPPRFLPQPRHTPRLPPPPTTRPPSPAPPPRRRTISRACAIDTVPDATASLVAGHSATPPSSPTPRAPAPASHRQCAPPTPHHRGRTPPPASPRVPTPRCTPSPPAPTPRPAEHNPHPTSDPPRTEPPRRAPTPTTPTNAPRPSSERANRKRRSSSPTPRRTPTLPNTRSGCKTQSFRAQPGRWKPPADPCPILRGRRRLLARGTDPS